MIENLAATLDQKRARHAWEVIGKLRGKSKEEQEDFYVHLKKLPSRIQAAGLGQALAFLEAKAKVPLLLEALAKWTNERRKVKDGDSVRLIERVIMGDADFLRFATAESQAYLQWLVRFAEAWEKEQEQKAPTTEKKG